jgi:hypothetical protein
VRGGPLRFSSEHGEEAAVSDIHPTSEAIAGAAVAEHVQCLHPNPTKTAPSIDRYLYEVTRAAILDAVPMRGEGIPLHALGGEVERRTPPGTWTRASVGWYTTVVKLDLEARGLLQRAATRGLQRLYKRPLAR